MNPQPPSHWQPPVPPWGPPPYGPYQQPVPAPQTSVLAVISLVAGLLWILWIGSVAAIITGHLARREVRQMGYGGDTLAILGLIFGYIGAATFVIFVLFPMMLAIGSR